VKSRLPTVEERVRHRLYQRVLVDGEEFPQPTPRGTFGRLRRKHEAAMRGMPVRRDGRFRQHHYHLQGDGKK